jgi:hypothetical protein
MKSPRQIPQVGVISPRQSMAGPSLAPPSAASPSMGPKMPQAALDTRKQDAMIQAIRRPPGAGQMVW